MDYWYIVLVLPAVLFTLIAQAAVKSTFSKYSKVRNKSGLTGYECARRILNANGLTNVRISHIAGNMTDNFNPTDNTVYLSDTVYGETTVAAEGVAAHEVGHAIQHATGYTPIKIRMAIIPVTKIGSTAAVPLILAGILLQSFDLFWLAYVGIAAFGMSTLFQLVTLPVEFNASRRAVQTLESMGLDRTEISGIKKVLTSAAMTYVAALAVSLMQLLRLIIIVGGKNNRRRR